MNTYRKSVLSVPSEKSVMQTINHCPFLAGTAVYKARTLYKQQYPEWQYNDLVICNRMNVYKGGVSDLGQDIASINNYVQNNTSGNINRIKNQNIELYPNPASTQLNIKYSIPKTEQAKFIIYSLTGNAVKEIDLIGKVHYCSFSISDLSSGIYTYKFITSNKETLVGKFVVE